MPPKRPSLTADVGPASAEPPEDEALGHPANQGLRRHFEPGFDPARLPPVAAPDALPRPYDTLGTHPDLVARLWDELARPLPEDCRAIFLGVPALLHPLTRVVFGFARGTHTYALRLPERERGEALRAGASRFMTYPTAAPFDLAQVGPEWVFCRWFPDETRWCLAAYRLAGDGPT